MAISNRPTPAWRPDALAMGVGPAAGVSGVDRAAAAIPGAGAPASADPGSVVARALAILEQETSQWQARRRGESDRPGDA